ncbi:MAG TPA: SUMF1/EgtB/PvdO family nonheme iron enzyme [Alphaproteobacteria bacterium]|nr:SUMF1/EgtB/PvdO family nonheme iron enzyme [Alphaproteobacteria bacterium]
MSRRTALVALGGTALAIFGRTGKTQEAPLPVLVAIPAGPFVVGSDVVERDYAYRLDDAAYGEPITRTQGWYDNEKPRMSAVTNAYWIARTPITNRQYAAFIAASGRAAPDVDEATWRSYRLIHPYERTRRHAWRDGQPPQGREDHPVVLVSHADARAYAEWLTSETRDVWRLPEEEEWEKAARGSDGRYFPWGNRFDPRRLNSHDAGPFDTMPVGRFAAGASPYSVLDAAGQVFEWTATADGAERFVVKGGSWDDKGCGVCRPAARHSRPQSLKHILIGFRVVRE